MLDSVKYDPHSPKQLRDIVGNEDTWKSIAGLIQQNRASHMVLVGPAGCGKSLFLRIAFQGFLTLYIDCTANFGLRDVRDSIRTFAKGSKSSSGNMRWLIFEHADSLTSDTQAFLRRMLETTSANTRILFECRDAGAISEPIYSRSTIVSVNAPEHTEMMYEINRRTEYKLDKSVMDSIVKFSYGNMRTALQYALTHTHFSEDTNRSDPIQDILSKRNGKDWVQWAIEAEQTCKLNGLDLRDVLRIGWPCNTVVANTCAQWSRLGGTSTRTLFFDCIRKLEHIVS